MENLYVFTTLLFFFIGLGAVLHYVNDDFSSYALDEDTINENLPTEEPSLWDSIVGSAKLIGTIGTMFLWSFDLGFWGNLILMPLRIIFGYTALQMGRDLVGFT